MSTPWQQDWKWKDKDFGLHGYSAESLRMNICWKPYWTLLPFEKSESLYIFIWTSEKETLCFKHLRIEIVGYFHPSTPGWLDFLPRQGPTLPANMPPEVQQILTDQEYQAAFFFPVTRMLWDKAFTGGLRLPQKITQQIQEIHDRIHESQKSKVEFLEASDQKHARLSWNRLDDGQLWGHQDGVWSADGSHGPSEKNHVPRHFWECPSVQRWLKWWFKIVGFFLGSCYIRPFSPFFFPAIKTAHIDRNAWGMHLFSFPSLR